MRLTSAGEWLRGAVLTGTVMVLAACTAAEVDDTTGSRFPQAPQGSPIAPAVPAGDITIVGQEVGHAILDLPEIANAAVPPLVQFTGVTSIIKSPTPIDTEPYTDLLRDRLLLITRLKLRFIEHTLPAYSPAKKSKKAPAASGTPAQNTTNPDYQIIAELRGRYDAETYRIQVQFVDAHNGNVLFNGLYTIRKEGATDNNTYSSGPDQIAPPADNTAPQSAPAPSSDSAPPDPYQQHAPAGNSNGIQ